MQWSYQKRQFLFFVCIILKYLYHKDRTRYHSVRHMFTTNHCQLLRQRQQLQQQQQYKKKNNNNTINSTTARKVEEQQRRDFYIHMLLQMHNELQQLITLEQWNIG